MSQPVADPSDERGRHALELFAPLARHYDLVASALSFGQDARWRRAMVASLRAREDEEVLDVACGTGLVAEELVRCYGCTVLALDQSPQMLAAARERVQRDAAMRGRVTLFEGRAQELPFADGRFDHLTFTYLLRYVDDPQSTLRELARVVAPGGTISSLEFGVPSDRRWRALWSLYTHAGLPLLGRAVSREWAQTGRFLAHSIPDFYERHPLDDIVAMWNAAGIRGVRVRRMSLGGGVVMWGSRGDGDAA